MQEIRNLFYEKGQARNLDKVREILGKRIEYVERNVSSLEKQIAAAHKADPEAGDMNESSGPIEIIEDLDEHERLVSGRTVRPAEKLKDARKLLTKSELGGTPNQTVIDKIFGLKDEDDRSSTSSSENDEPVEKPHHARAVVKPNAQSRDGPSAVQSDIQAWLSAANRDIGTSMTATTGKPPTPKPANLPNPKAIQPSIVAPTPSAKSKPPTVIPIPTKLGGLAADRDRQNGMSREAYGSSSRVIHGDNPEEALLRKQLLQYGMEDINAVVAELDIEDASAKSFTESEAGESTGVESFDDDDEEDEDMFGGGKFTAISPKYREQMAALQGKLNGPRPSQVANRIVEAEVQTGKPPISKKTGDSGVRRKKSVRFAESDETSTTIPAYSSDPMSEKIVETPLMVPTVPPSSKRKQSRFKSSLKPSTAPIPTPPVKNQEPHPPNPSNQTINPAPDPDAFHPDDTRDPSMQIVMAQIAHAHQRSRSKLIHQQGGFLARDPDDIDNEEEEQREELWRSGALVDENGKRISRFRASRLGRR